MDAVRATAREGEPDRHAAALLACAEHRDALMALAAFGAELARIPLVVREPTMGEMRLQWWHDAVDGAIGEASTGHPVADALAAAVRRHDLDPALLHRAIAARLHDLGRTLHADDAALLRHLELTEGSLIELALGVTGVAAGLDRDRVAHAAGRAYGLARALGRLPALLEKGGFPVPEARLAAAGVTLAELQQRPVPAGTAARIGAALDALRRLARADLGLARSGPVLLGSKAIVALLPIAMVEPYFEAQERGWARALERVAGVAPLGRLVRLWWVRRRGRF
jgi:phytoene synthase